jgi:hypothetical protein
MRSGTRWPLAAGLACSAAGLALFSRVTVDGGFATHVLPGMVLLGVGAGTAFNPMLLVAMGDADPSQAGAASGIVNTSFMMGGALGLAVLASIAAARTDTLLEAGDPRTAALTGGYRLAFLVGALFAAAGAALAAGLLRPAPVSEAAPAAVH